MKFDLQFYLLNFTMSYPEYIILFILTFGVSVVLTLLIKKIASRTGIVDKPNDPRKVHQRPIPLLGGLAIFLSFWLVMAGYTLFSDHVLGGYLLFKYLVGMFVGGAFLMIAGYLDDKYNLTPKKQIIWPILAVCSVIACGIGIDYITNPLGGVWYLNESSVALFSLGELPYRLVFWADLFTLLWLMGMMYTTKFLDGLDGLVPGITVIGSLVLFFLSINQEVAQPETALLAIILAGAVAGFLVFNWHPAKIFLGEGGSLLAGFMLGVLAIISGGKIATALLIMGIPILDVIWVIIRRLFFEKRSPFKHADRKHLHFRLLDAGLSQRQAVLVLYFFSACFGGIALFIESQAKLIALGILLLVMVVLAIILVIAYKKRKTHQTKEI